ncbi:MAG TPA: hypothetical protein VGG71_04340 [Chitinophagaceae bacterium]
MKKFLYSLFLGLLSITATANCMYAQTASAPLASDFKANIRKLDVMEFPKAGLYIPEAKDVNVKATKDFESRFTNVSSAKWFFTNDGFEAFFVQSGSGNRAFYNKKGRWTCSVITYDENKLPRDLRAQIKSTYYDMTISQVQEIQNPDHSVYIVTLQDKFTIMVLKINQEGEMQILQELSKG